MSFSLSLILRDFRVTWLGIIFILFLCLKLIELIMSVVVPQLNDYFCFVLFCSDFFLCFFFFFFFFGLYFILESFYCLFSKLFFFFWMSNELLIPVYFSFHLLKSISRCFICTFILFIYCGYTVCLAGSYFPDQGLNLGPSVGSVES